VYDYGKIHAEKTRLYAFGSSTQGALGLPTLLRPKRTRLKPMKWIARPVRHQFGDIRYITDIATGHGFTLVTAKPQNTNDYSPILFGSGFNTHSQLGFHSVRPEAPLEVLIAFTPIVLPFRKQPKVLALGAGRAHSIVSLEEGGMITFGDNSSGQCGRLIIDDEKYFGSKFFHKIEKFGSTAEDDVVSIASRFDVTFCVTRGGQVYSFGANNQGQLGRGVKLRKPWEPTAITGGDLGQERVVKVATSGSSVMAVTDKGDLFAWGDNECGQVNPYENCRTFYEPRHVNVSPKIGKVKDAAVGDLFSFVVNEKGNVYSWGQGTSLGLGPSNQIVRTPTIIPPPLFGRNEFNPDSQIASIYAGFFYAAAVTSQGDLYTWGKNEAGCLGLGDVQLQSFPLKVCLNGSVHKVGIGVDHTIVLAKGNL